MAIPTSACEMIGSEARATNVPARTSQAELMIPPVAAGAFRNAIRSVASFAGLLADARDEEDVVVDAEGDEDYETDSGNARMTRTTRSTSGTIRLRSSRAASLVSTADPTSTTETSGRRRAGMWRFRGCPIGRSEADSVT